MAWNERLTMRLNMLEKSSIDVNWEILFLAHENNLNREHFSLGSFHPKSPDLCNKFDVFTQQTATMNEVVKRDSTRMFWLFKNKFSFTSSLAIFFFEFKLQNYTRPPFARWFVRVFFCVMRKFLTQICKFLNMTNIWENISVARWQKMIMSTCTNIFTSFFTLTFVSIARISPFVRTRP